MFRQLTSKFTYPLIRAFSTSTRSNMKVTVLGAAGGIGQPLSLLLKQCPLINELALYDIANTAGVTADISHINTPAVVYGFDGKERLNEALHNSDIVMISAGLPRKPGMTRDDLFTSNAGIVQEMGTAIANVCPQALVGLITNPVNSCLPVLCETMMKEQKFDPRRVIGVTTLDEVRAATFVGMATNIDPSTLHIPVICGHSGITIVPLLSQCNPSVNIPEKVAHQITESIRDAGTRVVEAKAGKGSATIAMAWAGANFALKLIQALRGESNIVACGFILSDICDTKYFSLPMMLGRTGVRVAYGLPKMNKYEEELLRMAVPELKENVEKGIEFARNGKAAAEKSQS
ncbi:malate dehydrogenase, mitochondrial-like [Bradysia coprophila]|uniref:malate dehydrogenase, mitochondrial-like n=1 Tax=Bradysia coprophila TaxID=38358 RepID=UPI00187D9474|nr:malate dehydrogenase, mitochondrial-like [Bradysia coprophila]